MRSLTAAALAASALLFPAPAAHAAPCWQWSDAAGDSAARSDTTKLTADPGLDLIGAAVTVTDTTVVATFGVADLGTSARASIYERFVLTVGVNDKLVALTAQRDRASGATTATFAVNGTVTTAAGTSAFDADANIATLTIARSKIEDKAGPLAGQQLGWLRAEAVGQLGQTPERWDLAPAPAGARYAVGDGCTGPLAVPPAPEPEPLRPPTPADCATFPDGAGDGTLNLTATTAPNDDSLDLRALTLWATADELRAFVRLVALPARTPAAPVHTYTVAFTMPEPNRKRVEIVAADDGTDAQLRVAGGVVDTAPVTMTFGRDTGTLYLAVRRHDVEAGTGSALPDESVVTGVAARTGADTGGLARFAADSTAPPTEAEADKVSWTVGDNACFPPPPARLAVADVVAQHGDRAVLTPALTDAGGTPLPGRQVGAAVAGRTLTGTTDANGVATMVLPADLVAGTYPVTVSFTGDRKAGAVSKPASYRVSVETTRWTAKVTKATATTRTVVAKLLDDDRQAVAGQAVVWYVNGKRYATGRTDAKFGIVQLKGVPTGRTVTVEYAGLPGRYLAARATVRT